MNKKCKAADSSSTLRLTLTGMSKQEHGRQRCPPGSVAAGPPPPVTREPLSGGRRPSPLPEGHTGEEDVSALNSNKRISATVSHFCRKRYVIEGE